MGNKILASTANVELFERTADGLVLFATANTLTNALMNFSNSIEEVRGGRGSKLLGRFSHSSSIKLTLTDTIFDMKYLNAILGAEVFNGSASGINNGKFVTFSNHIAQLKSSDKTPVSASNFCGSGVVVWAKRFGCDIDSPIYTVKSIGKTLISPQEMEDGSYCVKYFEQNDDVSVARIKAKFTPREFVARVTVNEYDKNYAGGICGHLIFTFPRFQFDGTIDLSSNMNETAPFEMSGTVLTTDFNGCDNKKSCYGEIIEVPLEQETADFRNGLTDFIIDPEFLDENSVPHIWGIYGNKIKLLPNSEILSQSNKSETSFNGFRDENGAPMVLVDGKWGSPQNYAYVVICKKSENPPIPEQNRPYFTNLTPGVMRVETCIVEGEGGNYQNFKDSSLRQIKTSSGQKILVKKQL